MKRPQVSTNAGILMMFGGFLQIFNDVKLDAFLSVFADLSFGQLFGMLIPFVSGFIAIRHNEKPENEEEFNDPDDPNDPNAPIIVD